MINKEVLLKMNSRELIEFYVLNQEQLKDERNFKYFLGSTVGNNLMNIKNNKFNEKLNYLNNGETCFN